MAKETKKVAADQPGAPVTAHNWATSTVSGFEATRQEDLGMPFLTILQSMSPQIKKTDPNYELKKIIGAGEGDIISNLSNAVLYTQGRDPLKFIPCYHERLFVEWTPRNQGGGLVKMHRNAGIINECVRNERGQDVLKNGNLIVTTSYIYGLIVDAEGGKPAIIGMTSTQLKKARAWLNMAMSIRLAGMTTPPPFYSHVYSISTIAESNADGSWFGWKVEVAGQLNDPELIKRATKMASDSASAARAALPAASDEVLA
jgi:hypothetical protein